MRNQAARRFHAVFAEACSSRGCSSPCHGRRWACASAPFLLSAGSRAASATKETMSTVEFCSPHAQLYPDTLAMTNSWAYAGDHDLAGIEVKSGCCCCCCWCGDGGGGAAVMLLSCRRLLRLLGAADVVPPVAGPVLALHYGRMLLSLRCMLCMPCCPCVQQAMSHQLCSSQPNETNPAGGRGPRRGRPGHLPLPPRQKGAGRVASLEPAGRWLVGLFCGSVGCCGYGCDAAATSVTAAPRLHFI